MKKVKSISSIIILLCAGIFAKQSSAQSVADIFLGETEITWLGVDYSGMKFIGPLDVSATQLDDYAKTWNDLYLREPKKYNLTAAFNKQNIPSNLSYIEKVNADMNTDKVISSDSKDMTRFTKETIAETVKNYKIKGSGIGLVFITEALSKNDEMGSYWVTFIDMKTSSVLLTERVTGKAAGFGFRNYWAGSFYATLKDIKGKLYNSWKKKYSK
ncbi:MAG TPA: hypothetical protein PKM97_03190 [Bacteroidia bacterium]|nr:hypothetical protein [Bacteroidia bacterium]